MRKIVLFSFSLMLGLAVSAQGPVKLDAALKNLRVDKPVFTVDETMNMVQSPNPFVASSGSKAISEYVVGGSKYDLQSNSACQNRIYRWNDGTIATTWTMGVSDPNFADRGTGYNYYDGTSWGASPTARIETTRTGWPSIAPFGDGEIIVTHNGSTGLEVMTRTAKGTGTWNETTLLGPLASNNSTAMLWPRMITNGPNHNKIHIIATSDQDDPVATYMGLDLAIVYNRSVDGGVTWNMNNVVLPGMDSTMYKGFRGDAYAWAEPVGDTLAFVVGDNWYDLFLMKSTDGGTTWNKTVIFQHPYPMFDEAHTLVLDTPYVCEGGISVALDQNGMAHVVFGLMRVMNDDTTDAVTSYFPITDGMGYWNETMPTFTNIHVDSLYNQGYLVAYILDLNNDQQINWVGSGIDIIGRYYQSLVSQPYLIVDSQNNLYLVFTMVMETLNNGIQHYRHVWARKSSDGGATWSNFTDLTAASTHDFDECVFPSQAGVTDSDLHVLTQIDYEPGLAVRGDLDMYDVNDIVYITIPKMEVGTNPGFSEFEIIKAFEVYPNPTEGTATVGVNLFANSDAQLIISNIVGQTVMSRDLGTLSAGPQLLPIDLGSLRAGIYTLTLKAGNSIQSLKVVKQ